MGKLHEKLMCESTDEWENVSHSTFKQNNFEFNVKHTSFIRIDKTVLYIEASVCVCAS